MNDKRPTGKGRSGNSDGYKKDARDSGQKREFGKKEDKPGRSFKEDGGRPRRPSDRADKPTRAYGDRDKSKDSFNNDRDDRPKRSFNNNRDKKPGRSFDKETGRPGRSFSKEEGRPKRSFDKDGSDQPRRNFDNKPRRSFDRDDKPRRNFGDAEDKPRRSFKEDSGRPGRSFKEDDRPKRSFGREDKPTGKFDKDRKFNKGGDKDKGKPRRKFDDSSGDGRPGRKNDISDGRPKKFSERNVFHEDKPQKPAEDYEKNFITPKEFEKTLADKPQFAGIKAKQEDSFDKAFPLGAKKVSGPFRKRQEEPTSKTGKKKLVTDEAKDMTLNKYIAHSGTCSRREAADMVKQGKVKVNGELELDPGYRVKEYDQVTIAGKKLTPQKNRVYILLNKPKGYITTTDDPEGRETVMDLVKEAAADRLYPVGRLDRNTTGLLLLTNDGDLAQKLSHPSYETKKVYQVTLNKPLAKTDFDKIKKGLTLEDGDVHVDDLSYLDEKTELGIEIHSGRNRIVRRIFESLGYEVDKLDRVMYAGLTKKKLPRGEWRFLEDKEVILLKHFKS